MYTCIYNTRPTTHCVTNIVLQRELINLTYFIIIKQQNDVIQVIQLRNVFSNAWYDYLIDNYIKILYLSEQMFHCVAIFVIYFFRLAYWTKRLTL